MTLIELENAGFLKYQDQFKVKPELGKQSPYKGTYQKKNVDDKGILFFLNVEIWDWTGFKSIINYKEQTMMAHVQLELPNGLNMNVELLDAHKVSLLEVESFFSRQWRTNECVYKRD